MQACGARLNTPRGPGTGGSQLLHDMAVAMDGRWDKPYEFYDSWAETATALDQCEKNIGHFIQHDIDVWTDRLVALTKSDAALLTGDTRRDNTVDSGWANAKATHSSQVALHAIGPMREIFMAHNINNKLGMPGLVRIGEQHVRNLADQITDGKYHQTYEAFVADTRK